jgi:adenylate kinase family enzyme
VKRILVLGLPGSGKSTFAASLAGESGLPHVEADRLFWTADGKENPRFVDDVREAVKRDAWIFEGHFTKVRGLVLPRAEAVVWLDPPFSRVLFRGLLRKWKEPSRPGALSKLFTQRSRSLTAFRDAIQQASSRGVFTLVSHSGLGEATHSQSEALRAALGLSCRKS